MFGYLFGTTNSGTDTRFDGNRPNDGRFTNAKSANHLDSKSSALASCEVFSLSFGELVERRHTVATSQVEQASRVHPATPVF